MTRTRTMDIPTPTEPPAEGGPRSPALAIIAVCLGFLACIALIAWLMYRAGALEHNYYNRIMERGEMVQEQSEGAPKSAP